MQIPPPPHGLRIENFGVSINHHSLQCRILLIVFNFCCCSGACGNESWLLYRDRDDNDSDDGFGLRQLCSDFSVKCVCTVGGRCRINTSGCSSSMRYFVFTAAYATRSRAPKEVTMIVKPMSAAKGKVNNKNKTKLNTAVAIRKTVCDCNSWYSLWILILFSSSDEGRGRRRRSSLIGVEPAPVVTMLGIDSNEAWGFDDRLRCRSTMMGVTKPLVDWNAFIPLLMSEKCRCENEIIVIGTAETRPPIRSSAGSRIILFDFLKGCTPTNRLTGAKKVAITTLRWRL